MAPPQAPKRPPPRVKESFTEVDYAASPIKWGRWGSVVGLVAGLVWYGFSLIDSPPPVDVQDARQDARVAADSTEATPQEKRRQEQIEFALGRLNHESLEQQCDATIILGRLKADEAIGPLREMLRGNDRDPFVQTCVARALTTLGEGDVARVYYRLWIQSDDRQLFDAANRAYEQLGPEAAFEAMPLLTIVARSNKQTHRREIMRTLAAIGPDAEPLLTELAADADPFVKKKATEALAKLK